MIENPAKVEAKLKTAEAVAGAAGGGWNKLECFPPMAEAMTSVTRTGNQDTRSYL